MKFMEIIKELLLSLSIAVVLPTITYWGIHALCFSELDKEIAILRENHPIAQDSADKKTAASREYYNKIQKINDKKKPVNFFIYIGIGILAIIMGLMITVPSLSVSLMGGGIINIFIGICNSLNSAMLTFMCLFALFLFLIGVVFVNKHKKS